MREDSFAAHPKTPRFMQAIDQLSAEQQAAFAIDGAQRIIAWNGPCETLTGLSSRKVLGKHCFEVLAGRDSNGNLYCRRDCPVARQARTDLEVDDPVHPFPLLIKDATGRRRRLTASLFAVAAGGPDTAPVVHALREESADRPGAGTKPSADPATPPVHLSKREWQVLGHLAMGLPTDVIAEKLFISQVTVRNHIQMIFNELGVHSKLQAVVYAYRNNLVDGARPEIWPPPSVMSRPLPADEAACRVALPLPTPQGASRSSAGLASPVSARSR